MEQIAIISCIVIFILLCCYWLVKFILSIRKEFKLEEENSMLVKEINYYGEKFKIILRTFDVDDSDWGYYRMHNVENNIENALDVHPLMSEEQKNIKYIRYIDKLSNEYENFKNELIDKILPEIDYNTENWSKLKKSFPNFFVAESVGGIKDTLYCFSYNMQFDSSNSTFSGIVFTNVNSQGCIKYFNPNNWGIRAMSDYEFNKIFLPNILDKCDFNDARGLKDYSNYLKKEFKNFKENYE